jgi:hypothetical protein
MLESEDEMATEPERAPLEPEDALQEVQAAGQTMARRAAAPAWYHLGLGLIVGGLTANQASPLALQIAVTLLLIIALGVLVRLYRRRTGLWVGGFRSERTRGVAVGVLIVAMVTMGASVWAVQDLRLPILAVVCGVLNFAIVTAAGYLWEAAYRADLGAGRAP